ncbi:MAG: signal recognition particle protein, partial [Chloroflexota bacterium]|nr:signal recognition particle protein [Chloroflexota bacterium]
QRVRERALGAQVLRSLTPMQQVIDIVNQELIEVLGGGQSQLQRAKQPPTIIVLVGLKGSGKTTTAAKLGLHLRQGGDHPLLVAADPQRVAAAEQLEALGKQLNIPVHSEDRGARPLQICQHALGEARRQNATTVIVDTVGYLQMEQDALAEVTELRRRLSPTEVLMVADAMTGQEAVRAAEEFHKAVGLTGLILTKLDGDARGGAALSIRAVTGVPIKFVGVGEKADALEPFFPERFASRILGMGDILTLIDKAKTTISEEEIEALEARAKRGAITLEDFLAQFQRVKKMGPLSQLIGMIPGLSTIADRLAIENLDDSYFKRAEAIVYSMTIQERRHPDIIDGSRRRRIARGSGTTPTDVNHLLKQYREAKKIMQMVVSGRGPRIAPGLRWPL